MRLRAPSVAEIFAGMKLVEERRNVRDKSEHGEANYAGKARDGRGPVGGQQYQQQQQLGRQNVAAKAKALTNAIC